ncbi:MAG TPA: murein L,D-transpeptidase catalytic domain family protein [Ferruginibacter sp.]|nr:murein L,D-transpeptidase catalytic domain family protein [Ferruginibacter sp.]
MRVTRYALAVLCVLLLQSNSSSSRFTKKALPATGNTVSAIPHTETSSSALYHAWDLASAGLSKDAFEKAYKGFMILQSKDLLKNCNLLTIVDYSMSSIQKRLFVIEMVTGKILFNSLVAHGRKSGRERATDFSNAGESHKSSLGFFITLDTYKGSNGYSLKLKGCEKGINCNAQNRAIVMHGADYVSERFIRQNGYLGRSYGCPAVPTDINKKIIDVIKNGSCMFLYYPSKKYISRSKILNS